MAQAPPQSPSPSRDMPPSVPTVPSTPSAPKAHTDTNEPDSLHVCAARRVTLQSYPLAQPEPTPQSHPGFCKRRHTRYQTTRQSRHTHVHKMADIPTASRHPDAALSLVRVPIPQFPSTPPIQATAHQSPAAATQSATLQAAPQSLSDQSASANAPRTPQEYHSTHAVADTLSAHASPGDSWDEKQRSSCLYARPRCAKQSAGTSSHSA